MITSVEDFGRDHMCSSIFLDCLACSRASSQTLASAAGLYGLSTRFFFLRRASLFPYGSKFSAISFPLVEHFSQLNLILHEQEICLPQLSSYANPLLSLFPLFRRLPGLATFPKGSARNNQSNDADCCLGWLGPHWPIRQTNTWQPPKDVLFSYTAYG
jgi:hypothetical protein